MTPQSPRRAGTQNRRRRRTVLGLAALEILTVLEVVGGAFLMAMAPRPPADAASITVPCKVANLTAALRAANDEAAHPGPDTLTLAAGCTYVLTAADNADNGLPLITSTVVIDGNGSTISRDPAAPAFRLFTVGAGGDLMLSEVSLTGGSALGGGALAVSGSISLTRATVAGNTANGNDGGGLAIAATGAATVTDSTVSGNTARNGAAIASRGSLMLANSTVSGNRGTQALYSEGTVDVANSTVAANQGAGLLTSGPVTLTNSLFAGNPGGNCLTQSAGDFTDGGHNLNFGPAACPGTNADPVLLPLADNGGPTRTMALGANSPAVDQVPATGAGCPATDQRGAARPRGAGCDIGAYEADPPPAVMAQRR